MSDHFFGFRKAFDHPVTIGIAVTVAALLAATPVILAILGAGGRLDAKHRDELWKRYFSWLVLVPAMLGPVLLGAAWTIAGVAVLSLACYREYARATGLFRERSISVVVVLGTLVVAFASADHWYELFLAMFPITVACIAITGIFPDRPQGYIQRVALGVLGFALFGAALGHLGYFANDRNYRPILLTLIVLVELNDIFAYIAGRLFGKRKLAPNTSPGKAVAGCLGALVATTALTVLLAHLTFAGTPLDAPLPLLVLGVMISVVGQFGDLVLSSIKRDLGIKDMGAVIPGHGGLLDRFDSLLLVAPAVFHYLAYFVGVGAGQPHRIFSGG
ncbi:MAG: phosphatidate cytidylyltransferase [Planctomycetes bacterium]|nr:phosphatidate cytidylyltransferase [Planctomycetota bacterium]